MSVGESVPYQIQVKSTAFRELTSLLCVQMVDQVCIEFEKELQSMFADLTAHRGELERCAELLGNQLHRETQLQLTLDNISELQNRMVAQVDTIVYRQSDGQSIHEMMNQFQTQRATMEDDFNRITHLLQTPMHPVPQPHVAGTASPSAPRSPVRQLSKPFREAAGTIRSPAPPSNPVLPSSPVLNNFVVLDQSPLSSPLVAAPSPAGVYSPPYATRQQYPSYQAAIRTM